MIPTLKPALPGAPNYSTAFYPNPPSHDFCVWLIAAELNRRLSGSAEPLKVRLGLIDGMLGKLDFSHFSISSGSAYPCGRDRAYFDQMYKGVMQPAMEMIGAIEEEPIELSRKGLLQLELKGLVEYDYHLSVLVDAARKGYEIPKWKPPQWAFDVADDYINPDCPVITITLRECNWQPERNSNIAEWLKFADRIHPKYDLIFIRDTNYSNKDGFHGFYCSRTASENAFIRAALYQRAALNLFVCNGPNVWAMFSDAPYLIFKQLVPALPLWQHGQPSGWLEQDHLEVGSQLPWATPLQRFTWTDDTYENICEAFEAIEPELRR